eukprot:TRINITY_DN6591_c0_g2_i14.p1 TRINITY_DN6591_c0_g2~~TRINITY_DN6591_c0_g2_i14.p1  ORF type:complete len:1613 (+),score=295.23 TRINITY_DN6591_c0_g2_i14:485-4840(+)
MGVRLKWIDWKTFFYRLSSSLVVVQGRYRYFNEALRQTAKRRYLQRESEADEIRKKVGIWLASRFTKESSSDGSLVAEICQLLYESKEESLLLSFLQRDDVIVSMLSGPHRGSFISMWEGLLSRRVSDHKTWYMEHIKSTSKAGDALVGFFMEMREYKYLIENVPHRASKKPNPEDKVLDYIALARAYKHERNLKSALSFLEYCDEIQSRQTKPPKSLRDFAVACDEIGDDCMRQSRYEDAIVCYERGLNGRRKLYKDKSMKSALSYDKLGNAYMKQKDYGKAKANFDQAKAIRSELMSPLHPSLATSHINLSRLYLHQHSFADVVANLNSARSVLESYYGFLHPKVMKIAHQLTSIYELQLEFPRTVTLIKDTTNILDDEPGDEVTKAGGILEKMGWMEISNQRYDDALQLFEKALEIRQGLVDPKHPIMATAMESIAVAYYRLDMSKEAVEHIQSAMQIRRDTGTGVSVRNSDVCIELADLMARHNQFADAVLMCMSGQPLLGWNSWAMCDAVSKRLREAKRYREAANFWMVVFVRYEDGLGILSWRTIKALQRFWRFGITSGCLRQAQLIPIIECIACKHRLIKRLPAGSPDRLEECLKAELTKNPEGSKGEKATEEATEEANSNLMVRDLKNCLQESCYSSSKAEAASIAATLLNFMGFKFSGPNLSKIQIPRAILSDAVLIEADLSGAVLKGVDMRRTHLGDCKLDNAIMDEVNLGLPHNTFECVNTIVHSVCIIHGAGGQYLVAAGCEDRAIHLWDVGCGLVSNSLRGHKERVTSVCRVRGPKGQEWLASGSGDKTLRLWDCKRGKTKQLFEGHTAEVTCVCTVAVMERECWLVSGSADKDVRIWDINSGTGLWTLTGHESAVRGVCSIKSSQEEWLVASCSADRSIRIWNPGHSSAAKVLTGHSGLVRSVCSIGMMDGVCTIGSVADDGTLRTWDVEGGRELTSTLVGEKGVGGLCVVDGPCGERWIGVGMHGGGVQLRNVETMVLMKELSGHKGGHVCLSSAVGPNGEHVVISGGKDGYVRVWSVDGEGEQESEVGGASGSKQISEMMAVGEKSYFAYVANGNEIRVFDLDSKDKSWRLTGHTGEVLCLLSIEGADGRNALASAGDDGIVRIWDIENKKELKTLEGHKDSITHMQTLKGSKEQGLLVTAGKDNSIRLWDIKIEEDPKTSERHKDSITHMQTLNGAKDQTSLVTDGKDNSIRIRDVQSKKQRRQLNCCTKSIRLFEAFIGPNDEECVAIVFEDEFIYVWDMKSGERTGVLGGHTAKINVLASFPDASKKILMASASDDSTVRVWNLEYMSVIRIFTGHTGHVNLLKTFDSPTQKCRLISAGNDKTIRVWDLEGESTVLDYGIQNGRCTHLSVVPDHGSPLLISAHEDEQFRSWNLERKQQVKSSIISTKPKSMYPYKNSMSNVCVAYSINEKEIRILNLYNDKIDRLSFFRSSS